MDDQDPYRASAIIPRVPVATVREPVPGPISRPITQLWLLAAGLGVFTLGAGGWHIASGKGVFASAALAAAMVSCIYFATAVGVYRRSRVTAGLATALWVLVAVVNLRGAIGEMPLSLGRAGMLLVFGVIVVRGTLATFRHHRYLDEAARRPPRSRISDDPAFAPRAQP